MKPAVRVIIIDDAGPARKILAQGLATDPAILVIGTAGSLADARKLIVELHPDVVTVDVNLPDGSGIDLVRWLMATRPIPAIIVSGTSGAQRAMEALQAGAVDVIAKPGSREELPGMLDALRRSIRVAATAHATAGGVVSAPPVLAAPAPAASPAPAPAAPMRAAEGLASSGPVPSAAPRSQAPATLARPGGLRPATRSGLSAAPRRTATAGGARGGSVSVIALGASTGGTRALCAVLGKLPADSPPIVIVQHMPPGFTQSFTEWLARASPFEVVEARGGEALRSGLVLVAAAGQQLEIVGRGAQLVTRCSRKDKVSGHCPSVDVLFSSVAASVGKPAVAALLTGMGSDGAEGMLAMRRAGARTFAQDQASCVVFGMPRAAWDLGAAERLVPLEQLASTITACVRGTAAAAAA